MQKKKMYTQTGNNINGQANFTTQSAQIAPKEGAPLIRPIGQSTGGCCEGCRQEAAAKSATKASIASAGSPKVGTATAKVIPIDKEAINETPKSLITPAAEGTTSFGNTLTAQVNATSENHQKGCCTVS